MPIVVRCICGKQLRARDEQAGRRCKCPNCGRSVLVPYPVATIVPPDAEELHCPPPTQPPQPVQPVVTLDANDPQIGWHPPVPPAAPSPPPVASPDTDALETTWRGHVYWLLIIAVAPLVYLTFTPPPDLDKIVAHILEKHPDLRQRYEVFTDRDHDFDEDEVDTRSPGPTTRQASIEDLQFLIPLLPGRKVEGAFLADNSWMHWPIALLAAIVLFPYVRYAIPSDYATSGRLLASGLFTGTLGVGMLILVQTCCGAFFCIGLWYIAAMHPDAPFGPSLLGFVFGVGVCEETIKCIPVLWAIHRAAREEADFEIGWREACLIGMASGAGFGVSEGIHYCSNFYNGIFPADVYLVRFLSSAGLHIMLSGACGILIFRKQKHLAEWTDPFDWLMTMTAIMFVPIFLHGLFDTLLKKEMDMLALAVWLASFAWLAWLIVNSRKREHIQIKEAAGGPKLVRTEKGTRFVST